MTSIAYHHTIPWVTMTTVIMQAVATPDLEMRALWYLNTFRAFICLLLPPSLPSLSRSVQWFAGREVGQCREFGATQWLYRSCPRRRHQEECAGCLAEATSKDSCSEQHKTGCCQKFHPIPSFLLSCTLNRRSASSPLLLSRFLTALL